MSWVAPRRLRSEPIRLAALAILFAATMLAAIILPRQIRAALETSGASDTAMASPNTGASGAAWWTSRPARANPETAHRRGHKARAACPSGCKAADDTAH